MTKRKEYGQYIVADPDVCHGKLTFRGTRVFVSDVLEQVAEGMDWDQIMWEWHGHVSREAIAEAVSIARDALLKQHVKSRDARRSKQRVAE